MSTTAKVFFVLGGPGSGKGTNCENLVRDFGLTHFSAGDLLRAEAKKDTDLGKQITEILAAGQIVPSEVTVALLENAVKGATDAKGFLVDGFPRKLDQAKMFEDGIAKATGILYFDASVETMEKRLLGRAAEGSTRSDDTPEAIRKRLLLNQEVCEPVVAMYREQGRLSAVDANQDKDTVYATVKTLFAGPFGLTPLQ